MDVAVMQTERSDESDMMDSLSGDSDMPKSAYEEIGPDRQGPEVPDMEDEHSTGRKPYAKGGMAHPKSITKAIMMKRKMMAEGGEVDLNENSMEQANGYYKRNEDAALKENYDSDFEDMSQPMDSNEDGRTLEDADKDGKSMIEKIRKSMRSKRSI